MPLRRNWTEKEDEVFKKLSEEYEPKNWSLIAKRMTSEFGFRKRSGKQCRERWYNHLVPGISKQLWHAAEEQQLLQLHRQFGNKWTAISERMPGRTDNSIKNYFYSTLRRSLRRMGKLIGSKNSTALLRKIKPTTLTKIFCESEQLEDTRLHEVSDGSSVSKMYESVREQIIQFSSYKPKGREASEQEKIRYERVFCLILRLNEVEEQIKQQQKNNKTQDEIFKRDFKEMMNELSQQDEQEQIEEASQQSSILDQQHDELKQSCTLRTRTRQIKVAVRTDYPIISVPTRKPRPESAQKIEIASKQIQPVFRDNPQQSGEQEDLFQNPSFNIELEHQINPVQLPPELKRQTSPSFFGSPLSRFNFFNSPRCLQYQFVDYLRGFTPRMYSANSANTQPST